MLLYFCITFILYIILIISVTDCGDNYELKRKHSIFFNNSIYKFLFISLIVLFWFLTAFRGSSIGNDTIHYLKYYIYFANNGINQNFHIELGYQYFCLIISKINPDPYFLLFVCATICYFICGLCIYKHSNNVLFSTLLLFCVAFSFFTSGLRQSIAMVIVLIAYMKIKDNKKLIAIILILLASLFHVSALITLLWFAHKHIPKKPELVIIIALIISILAASGTINEFLANMLKKYQSYFDSENVGTGWLGISYYTIRAFVFYIFIYIACGKNKKENSLSISNSILLLITVCLGFSVNLFSRASLYFLLITVVDIPNAFNSGKIKNRDVWMHTMGIVMLSYFIVELMIRPEWNNLYPYEFNWN